MTQTTPKSLEQALLWIIENPHFEVGTEWLNGRSTHGFFRNHFDKLRVPNRARCEWAGQFYRYVMPNPRRHDDRMYAVTPAGKAWLRKNGVTWNRKDHP